MSACAYCPNPARYKLQLLDRANLGAATVALVCAGCGVAVVDGHPGEYDVEPL